MKLLSTNTTNINKLVDTLYILATATVAALAHSLKSAPAHMQNTLVNTLLPSTYTQIQPGTSATR